MCLTLHRQDDRFGGLGIKYCGYQPSERDVPTSTRAANSYRQCKSMYQLLDF